MLYDKIKNIHFSFLSVKETASILKRDSIISLCNDKHSYMQELCSLLWQSFRKKRYNIEYINRKDSKILFLITDIKRKSNEINFDKVVSTCIPPNDVIKIRNIKDSFSCFIGMYRLFFLYPVWLYEMRGCKLDIQEKRLILGTLSLVLEFQNQMKIPNIDQYHLFVTYYDSLPLESYIAQMFNEKHIPTATLQHGQFTAWRENTLENSGVEFKTINSKYLLCWNQFTRDEAVKEGVDKSRLPIVGIMSNIGKDSTVCHTNNNHIFGVVICHPSWHNENIEMIKAANILAQKYNLKYYLKLHPNYEPNSFDNIVNPEFYLGNIEKGIDVLCYANMVNFSIVGSSSMYVELIFCHHRIIRYSSQLPSDKYRDIKLGCVFHHANDITREYDLSIANDDENNKLFTYLCHTTNTKESYSNFFNRFK